MEDANFREMRPWDWEVPWDLPRPRTRRLTLDPRGFAWIQEVLSGMSRELNGVNLEVLTEVVAGLKFRPQVQGLALRARRINLHRHQLEKKSHFTNPEIS